VDYDGRHGNTLDNIGGGGTGVVIVGVAEAGKTAR